MVDMLPMSATQARKEWSSVIDSVVREKPAFISRTRDRVMLADICAVESLLSAYSFHAELLDEDDDSVTASLDEIDLVENGCDEAGALLKMAGAILEYAEDYYKDYVYWFRGARKAHLPYVFKALILNDISKIRGLIECRRGKI